MQTFLPYESFADSAVVLDPRRLGKQRVEALQVFRGLTVPTYGWRRHPAVRMWAGYEEALVRYGLDVCGIWTAEGRADTCSVTLMNDYRAWRPSAVVREQSGLAAAGELPPWLGESAFHRSHRSALLRKDPAYGVPDDLPYVWPASDRERGLPG